MKRKTNSKAMTKTTTRKCYKVNGTNENTSSFRNLSQDFRLNIYKKPPGSKIRACSHSDLGEFLF